jgi:predicted nucleic acid-binding protein
MKHLVDAYVLSELTRSVPSPPVIRWSRDHGAEVAINPIILGESNVKFS